MVTQAYVATDEDVPLFTGIPVPQPAVLPLDLVPQQFPRETCTLRNQSARWLWRLNHRKSKDCAPSSMASFRSRLRKIFEIIPEDTLLADIDSETLRVFVAKASEPYSVRRNLPTFGMKKEKAEPVPTKELSPTSIGQLLVVLKLVIASAIDHRGNKLFPLEYNNEHIDAPPTGQQHRPCLIPSEIEILISTAKSDQEKLIVQVLCASGLRISEIQAVRIGPEEETRSTWDYETASIFVRASCFRDREIPRVKTKAARRTVHLHSSVNELIARFAAKYSRAPGSYLFQDASGKGWPMRAATVRLNMAKRCLGAAPHAARRFRVTFLRQCRAQNWPNEDILKLEIGHDAGKDITNLYSRPSDEVCAAAIEAAGIGFEIGGKS
jgi:integrase